jgi:hypothetical protein
MITFLAFRTNTDIRKRNVMTVAHQYGIITCRNIKRSARYGAGFATRKYLL